MTPGSQVSPNRSRWLRAGRECRQAGDWAGAIRAYGQGLMEQPQWGRQLWKPIRGAVLQQPADLVHLSKPRLPAVVFGILYKRLCHGLPEPRELMGPLWTRLAVDLAQRFDGTFGMTPLAAARV